MTDEEAMQMVSDDVAVITAKVESILSIHDTRTAAAVMFGQSCRAIRALVAAGIWTKENVAQLFDETKAQVLTPTDEKPVIQYVMAGEPTGRPN